MGRCDREGRHLERWLSVFPGPIQLNHGASCIEQYIAPGTRPATSVDRTGGGRDGTPGLLPGRSGSSEGRTGPGAFDADGLPDPGDRSPELLDDVPIAADGDDLPCSSISCPRWPSRSARGLGAASRSSPGTAAGSIPWTSWHEVRDGPGGAIREASNTWSDRRDQTLPPLIDRLQSERAEVGFVLVDGDHSARGTEGPRPTCSGSGRSSRLYVVMHLTASIPGCRARLCGTRTGAGCLPTCTCRRAGLRRRERQRRSGRRCDRAGCEAASRRGDPHAGPRRAASSRVVGKSELTYAAAREAEMRRYRQPLHRRILNRARRMVSG